MNLLLTDGERLHNGEMLAQRSILQPEQNMERMNASRECKASSVLSKFKDMEQRVLNGEDLDEEKRKWPLNLFCRVQAVSYSQLTQKSASHTSPPLMEKSEFIRCN